MEVRREYVEYVASLIHEQLDGGAWKVALEIWVGEGFQGEELLYAWTLFPDPTHRGWLSQADRKYVLDYLK